jgi:hypothetical protein
MKPSTSFGESMNDGTSPGTEPALELSSKQLIKLREVCRLFDRAEALAKSVEEFNRKVSIPALNELRYAGHHVIKAISPNGRDIDRELTRAEDHCKRAIYDAGAGGLIMAVDRIDSFFNNFQSIELTQLLPD